MTKTKNVLNSVMSKEDKATLKMYISVFAVIVVVFYTYYFATRFTNRQITINKDDMLKSNGGNAAKNLVSDSNGVIYSVASSPLILHFSSSEVLNTLEVGDSFVISGYGTRVPALGLYPQIVTIKPVSKKGL